MKNLAAPALLLVLGGCAFPQTLPVDALPAAVSQTCPKLRPALRIRPAYPREALDARQDGWVLVEFDLPRDGVPQNVQVFASSPPGIFDDAAVSAVRKWRYAGGTEYKGCLADLVFRMR